MIDEDGSNQLLFFIRSPYDLNVKNNQCMCVYLPSSQR